MALDIVSLDPGLIVSHAFGSAAFRHCLALGGRGFAPTYELFVAVERCLSMAVSMYVEGGKYFGATSGILLFEAACLTGTLPIIPCTK